MIEENRLEELRDELNLKQYQIADIIGVAESTYSQWENNKIPIPTKRVIELANYYKVNIDYLFKLSNKKLRIIANKDVNLISIGKKLKEIREEQGLSLRGIGNKLNISFNAYSRYERGECLILIDTLLSISKIWNYSVDWILGRSKDKYIK